MTRINLFGKTREEVEQESWKLLESYGNGHFTMPVLAANGEWATTGRVWRK